MKCLVKNGSNLNLGDAAKIICDHVLFSHKNEWTQDRLLSPKELWRKPCDTDTGNEHSVGDLSLATVSAITA